VASPRNKPLRNLRCQAALLGILTLAGATSTGFAAAGPSAAGAIQQVRPAARDTLLMRTPRSLARADNRVAEVRFPVSGGESVAVTSSEYTGEEIQGVVDVLGGLPHGPEMNALSVYVASPTELQQICGGQALACYDVQGRTMIVSGSTAPAFGIPRDFTIAHEYGHHLANESVNSPWAAFETGTRHWATTEDVCRRSRRGTLYPGDEGTHYWSNPGEAFAETYAHLAYPNAHVPWSYASELHPTAASLASIRADLAAPWAVPTNQTWQARLSPRRSLAARTFQIPLDGTVQVQVDNATASPTSLRLLALNRRVVGRTSSGQGEALSFLACGTRSLRVEVRGGDGAFTTTVARP